MENKLKLPIDSHLAAIANGLLRSPNLILTAPPGSGKTLRVPAYLLTLILAQKSLKKIIVLVPKRIAAVSAVNFIAEENKWRLGEEVGYQVRFDNQTSAKTQLTFMTEGVFIKKVNDPQLWKDLELIIFDEFHERSANNDMAFGIAFERQMLDAKLKLLVMSATLDVKPLQKFLGSSELVTVDAPPFPLQIIKSKKAQKLVCDSQFVDQVVETVREALNKVNKDVLVFLPGLHEIRQTQNRLHQQMPSLTIEILHGSIPLDEQKRILKPGGSRRVVLSTNIAESSLTLPSVSGVIDSGLQKKSVIETKIGFNRLELTRISIFSAHQRAGRAARTGPGICYQLWHEIDERSMPTQIEPEILKSNLFEESLTLLAMDIVKPETFSWLEQPHRSFSTAIQKLKKWELVTDDRKVTAKGLLVQRCPLDIERSVLFIEMSLRGQQQKASHFLAYLETNDFSKTNHAIDLENLPLNDMGRRIEKQLLGIQITSIFAKVDFRASLIQIYLKSFPEKMAQIKSGANGLSSLGRGLEFAPHLINKEYDYYLLFQGRDISDSITKIDFALGLTEIEFQQFSEQNHTMQVTYQVDFEKRNVYKIEKKMSGLFVISESSRIPLNLKADPGVFKKIFAEQTELFLEAHPAWKRYVTRISFLKKRSVDLAYLPAHFLYLENLPAQVNQSIGDTMTSIDEFLNYELYQLLVYLTPAELKADLGLLPGEFILPNKKVTPIDYESELAPQISVRIQDILGQIKNPTILNGRIKLTIELLAPNRNPTQITSQLEQFWQTSYHEIRKELRARYPKHDWPENPLDWKPEMSTYKPKKPS